MGLTLAEAKAHADLIKVYDCKICGNTITIFNSKIDLIVTLHNNGSKTTSTLNLGGVCSRREREYRYKLDNHIFYNDTNLDHTYPIIETLTEVKV